MGKRKYLWRTSALKFPQISKVYKLKESNSLVYPKDVTFKARIT